jgi:hypothetical protein
MDCILSLTTTTAIQNAQQSFHTQILSQFNACIYSLNFLFCLKIDAEARAAAALEQEREKCIELSNESKPEE